MIQDSNNAPDYAGRNGAHTPGPWHVGGKDATIVFPEDGYAVADAKTYHGKHHEGAAQANARLIAAAPELLAELKRLRLAYVNLLESGRDRIVALGGSCDPVDVMEAGDPATRRANDVIAKAEGRQP